MNMITKSKIASSIRRFSTSNSPVFDFLVHKHNFSPESASKIASSVVRLPHPDRSDSLLSFLKDSGFSISQLEKVMKWQPQLLSAKVEKTIQPKLKFLQDIGFSSADICEIISNTPCILTSSVTNTIIPSLSLLKNILGSSGHDDSIVIKAYSELLTVKLDKRFIPNVEFLMNCGVPLDKVISTLRPKPRFMLSKQENMKKYVDKADAMGFSRSARSFIWAVKVIGSHSHENWEMKLRAFREVGFSDDDIARAFRSHPIVFAFSEKRIKESVEVIVGSGKYDISCIVKYPGCLKSSIEKRVKPRMQVLQLLESKNLIKSWPLLYEMCALTDKKFYEKFVGPFLNEIGDDVGKKWCNV